MTQCVLGRFVINPTNDVVLCKTVSKVSFMWSFSIILKVCWKLDFFKALLFVCHWMWSKCVIQYVLYKKRQNVTFSFVVFKNTCSTLANLITYNTTCAGKVNSDINITKYQDKCHKASNWLQKREVCPHESSLHGSGCYTVVVFVSIVFF